MRRGLSLSMEGERERVREGAREGAARGVCRATRVKDASDRTRQRPVCDRQEERRVPRGAGQRSMCERTGEGSVCRGAGEAKAEERSEGVKAVSNLPFRCPRCGENTRFRSLASLRAHLQLSHTFPSVEFSHTHISPPVHRPPPSNSTLNQWDDNAAPPISPLIATGRAPPISIVTCLAPPVSMATGPTPHVSRVTGPAPPISTVTDPTPHVSRVTGPDPHVSTVTGPAPHVSTVTDSAPHVSMVTPPAPPPGARGSVEVEFHLRGALQRVEGLLERRLQSEHDQWSLLLAQQQHCRQMTSAAMVIASLRQQLNTSQHMLQQRESEMEGMQSWLALASRHELLSKENLRNFMENLLTHTHTQSHSTHSTH